MPGTKPCNECGRASSRWPVSDGRYLCSTHVRLHQKARKRNRKPEARTDALRKREAAKRRRQRAKWKAAGLCARCKQPGVEGGAAYCDTCNAESVKRSWERRCNLQCLSCNQPAKMTKRRIHVFCADHLLKRRVWNRDYLSRRPSESSPIVRGLDRAFMSSMTG